MSTISSVNPTTLYFPRLYKYVPMHLIDTCLTGDVTEWTRARRIIAGSLSFGQTTGPWRYAPIPYVTHQQGFLPSYRHALAAVQRAVTLAMQKVDDEMGDDIIDDVVLADMWADANPYEEYDDEGDRIYNPIEVWGIAPFEGQGLGFEFEYEPDSEAFVRWFLFHTEEEAIDAQAILFEWLPRFAQSPVDMVLEMLKEDTA